MLQSLILLALGAASVAQGGMNRQFIAALGLPKVVLLNNLVLLLASVAFFLLQPTSGGSLRTASPGLLILPGVLGLSLVAGIPWAISRWGSSYVFIGLIGSQVLFSLLWDLSFEGVSFDWRRAASLVLAIGSLVLMNGAKT